MRKTSNYFLTAKLASEHIAYPEFSSLFHGEDQTNKSGTIQRVPCGCITSHGSARQLLNPEIELRQVELGELSTEEPKGSSAGAPPQSLTP
jgi:hypothetical protein